MLRSAFLFIFFAIIGSYVLAVDVPEFEEEFPIHSSNADRYRSFIARLRNRVRDPNTESHQLPVLPLDPRPDGTPPTRFFDVILHTSSRSVRLRLRRENLYLEGYSEENGVEWFEFDNDSTGTDQEVHLIPGSTFLGFDGGYDRLQTLAGARRQNVALGQEQLITAVNTLLSSTDQNTRARQLMIIIQMICEATRFTEITTNISASWSTRFTPTPYTEVLENSWQSLSGAVLHHDNNPEGPLRLPPNGLEITNLAGALAVLGLLIRQNAGSNPVPRRFARMKRAQGLIQEGRPLVEVFDVRMNNIDGENPGDLFGIITATDAMNSYYIYNRDREEYEEVKPGGYPTLTGPERVITAEGEFVIKFDLVDRDADWSHDDEIVKDKIVWNPYKWTNQYNKILTPLVKGAYGSATPSYVVMRNAAEAVIEVIMKNGDGEDPANVYGTIFSETSAYKNKKIQLFNRDTSHIVDVNVDKPIPLLRSAVAVPMDATLKITADLWDYDRASHDDGFAQGFQEFRPHPLKSESKKIKGANGEVEVRISWL